VQGRAGLGGLAGLGLGAWLGGAPAWAGNGIVAIEVSVHPNLTSIAVRGPAA